MNYFIVDDSDSIRAMLTNIIEEEELGTIVGEATDGSEVYVDELEEKKVDILLIDLLMPNRDGIETIHEIAPSFKGKIIMISHVETKEMIGDAYSLGIEYYITKPINRLEIANVLRKVTEYLLLEKSIQDIHKSLRSLENHETNKQTKGSSLHHSPSIVSAGKNVLLDLGIISVSGNKDLLDILSIMYQLEKEGVRKFPCLKELYTKSIEKRFGHSLPPNELTKEVKAAEQRIRRAIHQALEHTSSLGLTDFANSKFENCSSKFFDYSQVRLKMIELEGKICQVKGHRVNIKKFIHALYYEAKQYMQ
ncbi:response regulator [Bacillus sp. B15-48]|uniref:response regulator n=1 Tax=Bacillus sp. B15-48 TaxID=1548601 RepID=UPI00193F9BAA|nr:response regulator [Bacillus sp. B15-48]MBM4761154.1 response regulator [Bacillus sp. B15-48]